MDMLNVNYICVYFLVVYSVIDPLSVRIYHQLVYRINIDYQIGYFDVYYFRQEL